MAWARHSPLVAVCAHQGSAAMNSTTMNGAVMNNPWLVAGAHRLGPVVHVHRDATL